MWGVSAEQINELAVILLADCRQNCGSGGVGRNARHMVVIKTGAAEHGVYISVLPKGPRSFMKGLCQSRCSVCHAHSLQRREWKLRDEAGELFFYPSAESGKFISSRWLPSNLSIATFWCLCIAGCNCLFTFTSMLQTLQMWMSLFLCVWLLHWIP